MNIAFMADNYKKNIMESLCLAHREVFMQHRLFATGLTAKLLEQIEGFEVQPLLPGKAGGNQQLSALIRCNHIDAVFLFRNPHSADNHSNVTNELMRHCDLVNIPIATNPATAEALIHGLEHGDLDWRKIVD